MFKRLWIFKTFVQSETFYFYSFNIYRTWVILNSLSFFVSPLCSYQIYVILLWADLQCYTGWGVFWRIILPKGASNNFYYGMGPWPLSWIADELLSNPPDVVCTVCTIFNFSRHHSPRRSVTPQAVYGGPWRSSSLSPDHWTNILWKHLNPLGPTFVDCNFLWLLFFFSKLLVM